MQCNLKKNLLAFQCNRKHFEEDYTHFLCSLSPITDAVYQTMKPAAKEVSDQELKRVIADFLDQGHVDNIVAMFRRDSKYYGWTGEILSDERFNVRLGVAVLFEELAELQPDRLPLAIPSLKRLLCGEDPLLRGEAVSLLGTIGTEEAIAAVRLLQQDPNQQVKEMVEIVLEGL